MSADPHEAADAAGIEARLLADGWRRRPVPGFIDRIGPLWVRREEAAWAYGLLAGPEHLNPAGVVHGGLLATLADHALSAIAWQAIGRQPCVTVQLDTQFVAAANAGQFLQARGRVVRATGSLVFMQGGVQADGHELITASAVMKIVGPVPASPPRPGP